MSHANDEVAFSVELETESAPDELSEGAELADYLDQLEHALGLVAAYVRHEPELTLWCCRRIGEIALRCVHLKVGAKPVKNKSPTFNDLLNHHLPNCTLETVLGDANSKALGVLQWLGNIGVHARQNGRKESLDAIPTAIAAVVQVVSGLFSNNALTSSKMTKEMAEHLSHIRAGGRKERLAFSTLEELRQERDTWKAKAEAATVQPPRFDSAAELGDLRVEVARWRAKAEELADHIHGIVLLERPGVGLELYQSFEAAKQERDEALRQLTEQQHVAESKQAEIDALRAQMHTLSVTRVAVEADEDRDVLDDDETQSDAHASSVPLVGSEPYPRSLGTKMWGVGAAVAKYVAQLLLLSFLGAGGVGAVIGWGYYQHSTREVVSTPTALTTASVAVALAPSPKVGPPSCPTGTVFVPAATVAVAPPRDRPKWPRPSRTGKQMFPVDAFCIDERPRWTESAGGAVECEGNPQPSLDGKYDTCVDQQEAFLRCSGLGGRLPRVVEWERVADEGLVDKLDLSVPREWVFDSHPADVFSMSGEDPGYSALFRDKKLHRTHSPYTRWSWNRSPDSKRLTNIGYRCVFAADDEPLQTEKP